MRLLVAGAEHFHVLLDDPVESRPIKDVPFERPLFGSPHVPRQ